MELSMAEGEVFPECVQESMSSPEDEQLGVVLE